MKCLKNNIGFIASVPPQAVRREKEKARALRKTRWWQLQIARGKCHYCGRSVLSSELTMDHIVPIIRGGRSTRGNIVPACKACNNSKKYMLPVEWEEYLAGFQSGAPLEETLTAQKIEENFDG